MKEAGHFYVETEPALQPLHGEVFKYKSANKQDDARSDIKCLGFWSKMRQAFFDVKVVSPLARSYCELPVSDVLLMAEKAKSREYRERILFVEHGDFNPLVFTISGALGPQSSMVLKRLAEKISERQSPTISCCRLASTTEFCSSPDHFALRSRDKEEQITDS